MVSEVGYDFIRAYFRKAVLPSEVLADILLALDSALYQADTAERSAALPVLSFATEE